MARLKKSDWPSVGILLIAAFFRFYLLDIRPPHHDEGVNGSFVTGMISNGFYHYNPLNYHGPLHFYLMFLFERLFGENLFALRLPTALVSLLTVYWFLRFDRFFNKNICRLTAIVVSISPAFTFYGRYAIHESDLVFFTLLSVWGILGLMSKGQKQYLWALGVGVAGMIVSKETYVIHVLCLFLAWISAKILEHYLPSESGAHRVVRHWTYKDLGKVSLSGIFLVIFFYSGAFLDIKGLTGLYESYVSWFTIGIVTAAHKKPFFYWAYLMLRYEWVALLGIPLSLWRIYASSKEMRTIGIFGLWLFLVYSVVPYKTPWCVMNLVWPFCFVFADSFDNVLKTKAKGLAQAALSTLLLLSGFRTASLNFWHATDPKEPYVYTHTFNDVKKLTGFLAAMAKKDPSNYELKGSIILSSSWPLPWLLRDFSNVGYYDKDHLPPAPDADFLLVGNESIYRVEERMEQKYFVESLRLNSVQETSRLYLSADKFKVLFPGRVPEFVPKLALPLKEGEGLLALFYSNEKWSGRPVIKKAVSKIDFFWEGESRIFPAPFSAEFLGEIYLARPNTEFILSSDDGAYLEIKGERIIEDLKPHATRSQSGVAKGLTGWQPLKLGFYDIGGGAVIRLLWKDENGNTVGVPTSALRSKPGRISNGSGEIK